MKARVWHLFPVGKAASKLAQLDRPCGRYLVDAEPFILSAMHSGVITSTGIAGHLTVVFAQLPRREHGHAYKFYQHRFFLGSLRGRTC